MYVIFHYISSILYHTQCPNNNQLQWTSHLSSINKYLQACPLGKNQVVGTADCRMWWSYLEIVLTQTNHIFGKIQLLVIEKMTLEWKKVDYTCIMCPALINITEQVIYQCERWSAGHEAQFPSASIAIYFHVDSYIHAPKSKRRMKISLHEL